MPSQLRFLKQRGITLGNEMLRVFAPISTLRFAPGAVTRKVLEALEEAHRGQLERDRAAAKVANDNAELLKLFSEDNDRLTAEITSLRLLLKEKEEEVATARDPITVLEAVERAAQDFAQNLLFLKSAYDSAEESPYRHPDRVLQALTALSEVTARRVTARQRGESLGSLEKAFEERGQAYKAKESGTTKGKWAEEYEVKYEGKMVSVEPHLALGSGQPDSCLRIHFSSTMLPTGLWWRT